jgi:hypothetical protein
MTSVTYSSNAETLVSVSSSSKYSLKSDAEFGDELDFFGNRTRRSKTAIEDSPQTFPSTSIPNNHLHIIRPFFVLPRDIFPVDFLVVILRTFFLSF